MAARPQELGGHDEAGDKAVGIQRLKYFEALVRLRLPACRFDFGSFLAFEKVLRPALQSDLGHTMLAAQKQSNHFFFHGDDLRRVKFKVRIRMVKGIGEDFAAHGAVRVGEKYFYFAAMVSSRSVMFMRNERPLLPAMKPVSSTRP